MYRYVLRTMCLRRYDTEQKYKTHAHAANQANKYLHWPLAYFLHELTELVVFRRKIVGQVAQKVEVRAIGVLQTTDRSGPSCSASVVSECLALNSRSPIDGESMDMRGGGPTPLLRESRQNCGGRGCGHAPEPAPARGGDGVHGRGWPEQEVADPPRSTHHRFRRPQSCCSPRSSPSVGLEHCMSPHFPGDACACSEIKRRKDQSSWSKQQTCRLLHRVFPFKAKT